MNLKWAALLIIGTTLAELSSGSETQQANKHSNPTERVAPQQQANKFPRHVDTFLKPPPLQQGRIAPPRPASTSAPLPLMQRIARWLLSSEIPGETHQKPYLAQPPPKPLYGAQKALGPHGPNPVPQACRPCDKIPWIPMFPIKGAISDAVISLVSGQHFGGGGGGPVTRPKEPPYGPYISGQSAGEQLSIPSSSPQKYPTHTQAHFLTSLVPRPVHQGRAPPPPPPPPPYRIPPPPPLQIGPGDQRELISYLSPPYNRPSIYGQLRPSGPSGYVPQKEEITITIHENKNKPNGIYSIPGGPQIHLVSDFRPSGFGGTVEEFKTKPSPIPPNIHHAEIIPSVPIANYLSSIEYPMVLGQTHMVDLTNEDPAKRPPIDSTVQGRLPSLSGPGNELPIHHSGPEKQTQLIGPLPSTASPSTTAPDVPHSGSPHGPTHENAHQGGPYSSPALPHSSPAPQFSSPAPTVSSVTPIIYATTHSPVSHSGPVDLPTVSSVLQSLSGKGSEGQSGYSSTAGPFSRGVDSSTRSPISSTPQPYASSTESPKFSNSYSPPASTYVDIQPSLQTAEYLSSLPNRDTFPNNNVFKVHPGQGFRLSDTYTFPVHLNHHQHHSHANPNPKGHYITKLPPSTTPSPKGQPPNSNYQQRPPPSPFQPPKYNTHPSVPLAPNPSLWTRDHPYSYEIPPSEASGGPHNHDAVSTGTGQAQVPFNNHQPQHHFIEEPPIFSFIHNTNGGKHPQEHNSGSAGGADQNKWSYTAGSNDAGPSTVRPLQTYSSRPSSFYGQPPTPFTTSTTATPSFVKQNVGYSASTIIPNYSGGGYSPDDDSQNRNKGKRTKQVQIIIPYITGDKSTQIDTAQSLNLEQSVLHTGNGFPGGKSTHDASAIHKPISSPSADNNLRHWHHRPPNEEDYHVHQESRTVTASALHPNHLRKEKDPEMKFESEKDTGFQHVLASNLRQLLKGEMDQVVSENPLYRLQKNIDTWTAQQFSVKPMPVTSSEGLTTKSFVGLFDDHEASGSHDHRATARPDGTIVSNTTPSPRTTSESTSSSFWGIHSNLVIPEEVKKNDSYEDAGKREKAGDANQLSPTTVANWSKTQVAISPTTKEKVYVVTPMSVESWDDGTTTPKSPSQSHYTSTYPTTTFDPSPSPISLTVTSPGNPFTSPRFLVRPTPGVKTETWPTNGVFVTTTTDASVREHAADISSNDIFPRPERPRHKASEGTFAIYGPSGPGPFVTAPTPSYTLLSGTEVKTFTGHSRVVTSASSPSYSYTTSYSLSSPGKTSSGQTPEPEYEEVSGDSGRSSGRKMDYESVVPTSSPAQGPVAKTRNSFPDDYIRHFPEFAEQNGSLAAEEEATVKGVVVELQREPS